MRKKVAIIGCGLAGLTCCRELLGISGFDISLFEKCSDVGGRMRSIEYFDNFIFDHGAQYFTARSLPFSDFVKENPSYIKPLNLEMKSMEFEENKHILKELSSKTQRYTGSICIGEICKKMLKGFEMKKNSFNCQLNTEISTLERKDGKWKLDSKSDLYDIVIVSGCPSEIKKIFKNSEKPRWYSKISKTTMLPVGTLMISLDKQQKRIPFDAAFINHCDSVTWICNESKKPGKGNTESGRENWLVHFSPGFSDTEWKKKTSLELFEIVQKSVLAPFGCQFEYSDIQLETFCWEESYCKDSLDVGFLYDEKMKIGLTVDWINSDRVEGAFLSGYKMGQALKKIEFS